MLLERLNLVTLNFSHYLLSQNYLITNLRQYIFQLSLARKNIIPATIKDNPKSFKKE